MKDDKGRTRTGVPTMFVAAPIRDDSFQVVGVLALRIRPEEEFSRILQLGRFGETGETYAFDKNGPHGFQQPLRRPADPAGPAARPGGFALDPATAGPRSGRRHHDGPSPDRAAARAAADADGRAKRSPADAGVDVDGYRDYRGVPVVGAWNWLPDVRHRRGHRDRLRRGVSPADDPAVDVLGAVRAAGAQRRWRSSSSR